ncbi:unnamed protein product (macronuclear) [Paramecium tetraurelia]|uniref:RAP domain-containing protein n=1 Tax=Paramecium tetraurelia TaxID=5888 RepID=A0CY12_PARTE|nr:uncharacterized protein GSPATT00011311001 [Paramecium tetraurelia]CAK75679.1 unnamed protein product [Paramecium tetraurelia]|eukprot:XP_001443076.1 hypothetical protein (macronuclear) [Paramecium tetraurelia strain d4-2]
MNNPIFNTARIFLQNKYHFPTPLELFKHLITNSSYFQTLSLKNDSNDELLYKLIFIAGFHERRNCGSIVKEFSQNCLIQIRDRIEDMSLDIPTLIQAFLSMSNVLLDDEKIVSTILKQLKDQEDQITLKQFHSIQHCLYKLGRQNNYWSSKACDAMTNNLTTIIIQDYVQYLHIASNLYQFGLFQEEHLIKLLDILYYKLGKQQKHIYSSKFTFQFAQMMFNIYPEIINQPLNQLSCKPHTPFEMYFQFLKRDYQICRQILQRKNLGVTIDYFENENFPFLLRLRQDSISRTQTLLETEIIEILNKLQLKFLKFQKVLIYDVDFKVMDNYAINCNGPLHFISTLDGKIKQKSFNTMMQYRHLKALETPNVIDFDFFDWKQEDSMEFKISKIKTLLNLI